ncbi:MAG TPA: TIGR03086 family metal-binding protein [Actinomycetes bacterium]|jgi:uncharacterized protein (TIGR03086 family)|nr:TIGR03086 family metal-binding protein [Actinomycetes bacterium]
MTDGRAAAPLIGGVALLERAIGYTLGCLSLVTPAAMSRPTPCRAWDLRALLGHMNDSLMALQEASDLARVELYTREAAERAAGGDPVAGLRYRARRLLGAWTRAGGDETISIAGRPLLASIVTSAGALEVAVHGWDVARACGQDRPMPPLLAEELLELAPLLVSPADRPARFAAPVHVSPLASASDLLLAYLGREPG